MVTLDRALVSSVTMSLAAAVWPQFAMQVFRGSIGRLTCIGSYVNKQVTTFTFRAQATTCSKHYTRTVMDAGCECAPRVRSANPSDSWALVINSMYRNSTCSKSSCDRCTNLGLSLYITYCMMPRSVPSIVCLYPSSAVSV